MMMTMFESRRNENNRRQCFQQSMMMLGRVKKDRIVRRAMEDDDGDGDDFTVGGDGVSSSEEPTTGDAHPGEGRYEDKSSSSYSSSSSSYGTGNSKQASGTTTSGKYSERARNAAGSYQERANAAAKKREQLAEKLRASKMAALAAAHPVDETEVLKVAKKERLNLMTPLGVLAAVYSTGYLLRLVTMHAKYGVGELLYSLLFEDPLANIALSVLLLYTHANKRIVTASLTTVADFVRPTKVNFQWWISLFVSRSIPYVTSIFNATLVWNLGNQFWSLIPLGIDLIKVDLADGIDGTDHFNALVTSIFDANSDGIVTTTEVQMWFVAKTLRLLWCSYFFTMSRWLIKLKSAPNMEEMRSRGTKYDKEDFLSQALRHHFSGVRGDRGVTWEQQARSSLVDKGLTVATYVFAGYSCLNALGVNMTGLLAVGGVSGIAIGFAAQKLVSNCIGGILIFLTQPFVEGDHVILKDASIEGRVEVVGWHSTRIASLEDGYSFIVPNTDILGSALRNLSRREYVPIKVTIPFPDNITAKETMHSFMKEIESIVYKHADAYSVRRPEVAMRFTNLTPSIRIKAFIDEAKDPGKAMEIQTEMMEHIKEEMANRKWAHSVNPGSVEAR
jgi:small-conductance mechanosensitive channel